MEGYWNSGPREKRTPLVMRMRVESSDGGYTTRQLQETITVLRDVYFGGEVLQPVRLPLGS